MRLVAIVAVWALMATGCHAAEFRRISDQMVELSGPIVPGDLAKLEAMEMDFDEVLSLHSNGGNFQEGLAIARYVYENKIGTVVTGRNVCLSACAVAFLGGASLGEESSNWTARSISPDATLGFHAPFLKLGPGNFTEQQVQTYYDRAVTTIVDVVASSSYFQADHGDIAELMRPQRTEMLFLDSAKLLGTYHVAIQGLKMPARITPTMAASLCANGWYWAHNDRLSDITAFEKPDVYADSQELMKSQKWDAKKATVRPYSDAVHTLIPITKAREGATMYCSVEQLDRSIGIIVACNGFFDAGSLAEAKQYVQDGGEMRYPCSIPLVIEPLEDYEDDIESFSVARALVPPHTPKQEMIKALADLQGREQPLPKP